MNPVIEKLKGKLIVSCQALAGNALRNSHSMAVMARAAMQGGAAAIRANGVDDIKAIRELVDIPIIGINKTQASLDTPYITPDFKHAEEIASLDIQIIALDATLRPRPDGSDVAELIRRIKQELNLPVMADIATLEEGIAAEQAGADIISTTLAGYTQERKKTEGPDLELLRELTTAVSCPIIGEGRFLTPQDMDRGFEAGAHAIVIGKIITNPEFITRHFISNCKRITP